MVGNNPPEPEIAAAARPRGASGPVPWLGTPLARLDARVRVGSITKSLTATLALLLAVEGRLDLDEPCRATLELRRGALGAATWRHVISHTAGLPTEADPEQERIDAPPLTADALLAAAERIVPDAPGTRRYSNFGYGLLGAALERRAGVSYEALLQRRLLTPLGMTATTLSPPPSLVPGLRAGGIAPLIDFGACAPAGQLYSTLRDVLAWGACLGGEAPAVVSPVVLQNLVCSGAVEAAGGRFASRGVVPGYACALVVVPDRGAAAAWTNHDGGPLAVLEIAQRHYAAPAST
jgi:CubicO group peptidase (beta-lactamase class C family)